MGVTVSYLLDKYGESPEYYRFKHHYILQALDSEILLSLFEAIGGHKSVKVTMLRARESIRAVPFKIYISTQYGRQHMLAWIPEEKHFRMYRLDHILKVKIQEEVPNWDALCEELGKFTPHLWGAASYGNNSLEHLEFEIYVGEQEGFVEERLRREKRCGTVTKLDERRILFSADVYSTREMLPWVRTFVGRILRFECSNPEVERCFWDDLKKMEELYGLESPEGEEP